MTDETKRAFDWMLQRWPDRDDIIRSYPMNMFELIAEICAEYHKTQMDTDKGA